MPLKYKTTADIKISKRIVDQVIGQEAAVNIIRKAAQQRRHVFLIGAPGTGKSMLGLALAELLPKEKLVDTLSFYNQNDENAPLIRTVPAGQGRQVVAQSKLQGLSSTKNINILFIILLIAAFFLPYWWWIKNPFGLGETANAIIFAASMVTAMFVLVGFMMSIRLGNRLGGQQPKIPKIIVDNFNKKQAPFFDATGAHAGALLGDVLHDPFQTFLGYHYLKKYTKEGTKEIMLKTEIDALFNKYTKQIIRGNKGYEAIYLPKNELIVQGETNGSVSPVEVLSSNRYDYDGEMIKLITSENKELIVTPEHKIAIFKSTRIDYVEAKDIQKGDVIISKSEDIIIDEEDIINTYDARQQEQCRLYYQYLEIKSRNPTWGHKRIARAMSQPYGKTRWWHAKKHIPIPIQTASWLKEKGLLPLKIDNQKLSLIAKVLGATFGDGGIFENLNGIFLSSKEKYNVEEFGRDIEKIFDLKQTANSRLTEGGEFGHSWCYQNTNRNIIRFFMALGSPTGKKSSQELRIPCWIQSRDNFRQEFFSSLFGSELGIPKLHGSRTQLNTFDFAITGEKGLRQNRINFLKNIKSYLHSLDIKTGEISTRIVNTKYSKKGSVLYRFLISTEFQSLINFVNNCKLNYCKYKRDKLTSTINEFKEEKRRRYEDLLSQGHGAESAMKTLNLTPRALYEILNETKYLIKEHQVAYG